MGRDRPGCTQRDHQNSTNRLMQTNRECAKNSLCDLHRSGIVLVLEFELVLASLFRRVSRSSLELGNAPKKNTRRVRIGGVEGPADAAPRTRHFVSERRRPALLPGGFSVKIGSIVRLQRILSWKENASNVLRELVQSLPPRP